jgi:hypothetical protein
MIRHLSTLSKARPSKWSAKTSIVETASIQSVFSVAEQLSINLVENVQERTY